jgi:hypothetical protein
VPPHLSQSPCLHLLPPPHTQHYPNAALLAAKQTRLAIRHYVLSGTCEFLSWLRTSSAHAGWADARVAPSDEEVELVRKLQCVRVPDALISLDPATTTLGLADTPLERPLATPGDFLGPLREVLSLPPPADVCSATEETAAAAYHGIVQAICNEEDPGHQRLLHLTLLGVTTALGVLHQDTSMLTKFQLCNIYTRIEEKETDKVGSGERRGLCVCVCVCLHPGGGGHSKNRLPEPTQLDSATRVLSSWTAGQPSPPPPALGLTCRVSDAVLFCAPVLHPSNATHPTHNFTQDRADRAARVVAALNLTPEQRQLVLGCHDAFGELLSGMRVPMDEGMAEVLLLTSEPTLNSSSSTCERNVQGQQDASEHVAVLMRKERLLRVCWAAYVASMCNVDQLSRAALAAWPSPLDLTVVGAALHEAAAAETAAIVTSRSRAAGSTTRA